VQLPARRAAATAAAATNDGGYDKNEYSDHNTANTTIIGLSSVDDYVYR
jgi:hypothetical protein